MRENSMKTNLDIYLMFPYRVHQSKTGMLNLSKVLKDIIKNSSRGLFHTSPKPMYHYSV